MIAIASTLFALMLCYLLVRERFSAATSALAVVGGAAGSPVLWIPAGFRRPEHRHAARRWFARGLPVGPGLSRCGAAYDVEVGSRGCRCRRRGGLGERADRVERLQPDRCALVVARRPAGVVADRLHGRHRADRPVAGRPPHRRRRPRVAGPDDREPVTAPQVVGVGVAGAAGVRGAHALRGLRCGGRRGRARRAPSPDVRCLRRPRC